jgi:hypothetical protein
MRLTCSQTNLQQMYVQTSSKAEGSDETHFVFTLEQPYDINHLTVFLTGGMYLPDLPLAHHSFGHGADGSSISRRIWRVGPFRLARERLYTTRRVCPFLVPSKSIYAPGSTEIRRKRELNEGLKI